ncbi:hypothetical protein TIFTF001_056842 [Ficus carica]|uniref:Uncharacterized protein n=1 Tax=Ficus carica TaxID=3494 RepID=A0AA88EK21_FICCA|nr:hypothetical protein TIFTF001_056839 [Ficus carica]GMN75381.1 hypothetical protein TIFTF001_056840 [Ficus carica]GMN75385.1 hypothetical protein TIFTF001_056841 [Ficus carica]GMN75389.1 hypothetical protein TIFTF001_056842 [Ficus carica]
MVAVRRRFEKNKREWKAAAAALEIKREGKAAARSADG